MAAFRTFGRAAALCCLLLACCLFAAAPKYRLPDPAGAFHTDAEWRDAKAVVLMFVSHDCPISTAYAPEIRRIHERYQALGVRFFAVLSEDGVSNDDAARFVKEFGLPFPLLMDPQRTLAKSTGARVTPEVIVFDANAEVRYQGRIDDRYVAIGTKKYEASQFDLRDSLTAILEGKPVPHSRTKAVGCVIPML